MGMNDAYSYSVRWISLFSFSEIYSNSTEPIRRTIVQRNIRTSHINIMVMDTTSPQYLLSSFIMQKSYMRVWVWQTCRLELEGLIICEGNTTEQKHSKRAYYQLEAWVVPALRCTFADHMRKQYHWATVRLLARSGRMHHPSPERWWGILIHFVW